MSRLTSLQILNIINYPHLEKRCQKDIAPQSAILDIENIFLEEEEEEDFEGKEVREEEKHWKANKRAQQSFCNQ
ncbi:hypothetical protein CMV_016027 [Castanea mollissima]|uniref:Uncharacterized protein n=1 Tax=Castanea mollissima TaxID=60419 RepID=A0A8J4QUD5_9ROSI|nr:hypothetical protein CMV_016027 [Castanea mollissima]